MASAPAPHLPRDLRCMIGDGVAFSAMVGLGETYLPAFALAVGFGEITAGWVATLPMLAGAVLQLVTPLGVRRLGSYRRWVVACARLQALSFLPLVVGALLGRIDIVWLFLAAASYWGFGMATGPAWNAWVTTLVPRERRARFFARRSRWGQVALLSAILAGGAILDAAPGERSPRAFAVLFALAIAARLASARYLAAQGEPPGLALEHRAVGALRVLGRLRHGRGGRLLAYLLATQVAVHVSAPFFTPYMLGPLELSYLGFTVLTGASLMARILALPLLGRVAHARGTRRLLWLGGIGIVPLPSLWLVSSHYGYLLAVQCVAGVAWAAFELATLLAFFEGLDESDRASILTAYNLASAVAIALGSLVGGRLFAEFGDAQPYAVLFLVSAALRALALPLLRGAPLPAVAEPMELRTLAVRPSLGALQRPILATLPEPTAPAEAATDDVAAGRGRDV